jgi:hypothetical protein
MITHTYSGHVLRIYINEILHLSIPTWVAVQSWMDEGQYPYKIEYYLEKGQPVLTEYDTREKWSTILDIVDRVERLAW